MERYIQALSDLRTKCADSNENYPLVLAKHLYYRVIKGKRIFAQWRCAIKGLSNISIGSRLDIGLVYRGFTHKSDQTLLSVQGKLVFRSNYNIGRGCRFDIGPEACAVFGRGFANANSLFVIMHRLDVGDDCVISWNCQFIDDDFHTIRESRSEVKSGHPIVIGDHVWVGCNVTVLRGVVIPNGCVVAAGSVVTKPFEEENALIAGVPAKIVRRGIAWE